MLLLVPSQKVDELGANKDTSSHSRVLVVLPSDTDLSSTVVVPDTAITTTLGTSDTLMEAVGVNLVDPLAGSRDHLGILQLSSPLNKHRVYHLPARQRQQQRPHQWSNALTDQQDDETDPHNLLGQQQQRRQPHPHPSASLTNQLDNNGRFRRHSHTGLVSSSVQGYTPSQLLQQQSWPWSCSSLSPGYRPHAGRPRSRSRQSSSNALSYQHQLIRTPRALRSAFRKARKDQSPLLTSASLGADQAWSHLVGDLEEDDYELSFLRRMSTGSSPHGLSDRSNIGYYYNPARTMGQIVEAIGELSTSDGSDVFNNSDDALVSEPTVEMVTASQVDDDCQNSVDNSRIDINPDDNGNAGELTAAPAVSERSSLKTTSMHLIDKSPETLDIMDEVLMNETSTATGKKHRIPLLQGEQKFGLGGDSEADGGTPDTDMNMILGIASDMELVMPQFDDEYLEDLKNDPVLRTLSRRSSSVSTLSSACSRSPSTTITNSNQFHHSPRSQHSSLSPAIPPADLSSGQVRAQPAESVPVSPGVLAARQGSLLPVASEEQKGTRQVSPNVNRDIDNLRRHQYSLKQSTEMMNADSSPARSLQSSPASPASSTSQNLSSSSSSSTPSKGSGPIYFKPSHHSLPPALQSSMEDNGLQNSKPGMPIISRGVINDHALRIQRNTASVSPPLLSSTSAIKMTANNISMATAHMNVLTPREVQEEYYARRNLRILQQQQQQQKQRQRKSLALVGASSAAHPAFVQDDPLVRGPAIFAERSRHSSVPSFASSIHPLEIPVASAVGSSQSLPASYYIPPSAFRTEAAVAAELEAERRQKEEEEDLKDSFLIFPSPTPS